MTQRVLPLEIRGFSRGNFDFGRPLPERPEDSLPYLETVREAPSSYCTPPSSGHSSPTLDDIQSLNNSCESFSWSSNTGNLTGRSSVTSWGNNDEFEKKASAQVRHMFEEIDNMLFERKPFSASSGSTELLSECDEWSSRFPHLRVQGVKVSLSDEEGVQEVPLSPDDPRVCNNRPATSTSDDLELDNDLQGLVIQGCGLVPKIPEPSNEGQDYHQFVEEVFACHGQIEEYFAYDRKDLEGGELPNSDGHAQRNRSRRDRRMGFPPVTPNACAKDAVSSQIFDQIWSEVMSWLRSLLNIYLQGMFKVSDKPSFIPSVRPAERPIDAFPIRPVSRDVNTLSYFPSQIHLQRQGTHKLRIQELQSSMQIKQLQLKHRSPSAAAHNSNESRGGTPFTATRPGSSNIPSSSHLMKWRSSDIRQASAKYNKSMPRHKQLAPLDRAKTPSIQDTDFLIGEVLKGTRLSTGNDRSFSPLMSSSTPTPWGSKNGALPPLEKSANDLVDGRDVQPSKSTVVKPSKVSFSVRASSAATNDSRRSIKDRPAVFSDSRPNTTHSFRQQVDPTFGSGQSRRLSTPMASLSVTGPHLRTMGSFGYNKEPIGMVPVITGVSMNINPLHPGPSQIDSSTNNIQSTQTTQTNQSSQNNPSSNSAVYSSPLQPREQSADRKNDIPVLEGFVSWSHSQMSIPQHRRQNKIGTSIR